MAWLVFDIDFGGGVVLPERAVMHYEDVLAPPPNIIVINRVNGHAHYFYALKTPVVRGENARAAPLLYAEAVYRGLGAKLGADPRFAQLLARNPVHPSHLTLCPCSVPYELSDLNEYIVDRAAGWTWKGSIVPTDLSESEGGRNSAVFDAVRRWAYEWIDEYRSAGASRDTFIAACLGQAEAANDFPTHQAGSLSYSEVKSIAKSVGRWVWRRYTGERGRSPNFSARQAFRGRLKGARKRIELLPRALELAEQGLSLRAIGAQLGVDHKTVGSWLRRTPACK